MKRLLLLLLLLPSLAFSQSQGLSVLGNITRTETDCTRTDAGCVLLASPKDGASMSVQITGTFTATLSFETTSDGTNWAATQGFVPSTGAGATSATNIGIWQFSIAGLSALRVRASAYTSGTASVFIQSSVGPPFAPSSFSGSISGNACSSATGAAVPAEGCYLAVSDSGLIGLTGTAVGGKESLNVDILATVAPTTLPLPTLASTSTKQSDGSQKTQVVDGSGNVIGATSNALDVNIKSGVSPGVAQGSTTSGQLVAPSGCATVASGSFSASQTNMITCDTGGNLRVAGTFANASVGVVGTGVTSSASQTGLDVSGTMRRQTGSNPSGSIYAAQTDIAVISAAATGTQTAANSDSIVCATDTGCIIKAASGAIASGAIASGAIASGAVASGAYASGSIASGAIVDGANVVEGTTSDAAATIGSTGTISAKLRTISAQLNAPVGCSNKVVEPAASDNHSVVQNGATVACGVIVFNNSATVNYGRLYNAGTGFNGCNSATNLVFEFQIPASTSVGGFVAPFPQGGIAFATGLSLCVTGAYGQTDTTNATASAISLNVQYR